jgi:hypothetical protein
VLAVLLVPLLASSLATPFGLVDDLGDWQIVAWLDRPGAFLSWCRETFLGHPARYRPWFDLTGCAAWALLGDAPATRHALRWAVWLAAAGLGLHALRVAGRAGAAAAGSRLAAWTNAPAVLFLYLFLLGPNQPASRLAPQELPSATFLALVIAAAARLASDRAGLAGSSTATRALLLAGYAGLSLSKEPNVAPMGWTLVWLLALHARPMTRGVCLYLAAMAAVLLFTVWRVGAVHAAGGYAIAAWRPDWPVYNLRWLWNEAFYWRTQPAIALGLVALPLAAMVRAAAAARLRRWTGEDGLTLFAAGCLVSVTAMAWTSWAPAPRYWYPTVLPLALLASLGTRALQRAAGARRTCGASGVGVCPHGHTTNGPLVVAPAFAPSTGSGLRRGEPSGASPTPPAPYWPTWAAIAFALLFAATHYANTYYQYAIQRQTRRLEAKLLADIGGRLARGERVAIGRRPRRNEVEIVQNARDYFRLFRPRFHGETPAVLADAETGPLPPGTWLVSPRRSEPGCERVAAWHTPADDPLLRAARTVAGFAQGRRDPVVWVDAGVFREDYAWYLHRPLAAAGRVEE